MNAEQYLGETQPGARIVAGDAVTTGQGQLQSPPQAEAVDQGNRRQRQRFDAGQYCLAAPDELQRLLGRTDGGKFMHVGTGDETSAFPGANDHRPGSCPLQPRQQTVQLVENLPGEAVGAAVGAVEGQMDDPVVILFKTPVAIAADVTAHDRPPRCVPAAWRRPGRRRCRVPPCRDAPGCVVVSAADAGRCGRRCFLPDDRRQRRRRPR